MKSENTPDKPLKTLAPNVISPIISPMASADSCHGTGAKSANTVLFAKKKTFKTENTKTAASKRRSVSSKNNK